MQMEIFKIEKQQSIHKVLEKKSKASRPVTELSEYILKIFNWGTVKYMMEKSSGSFPNLLISLEVRTLFSLHQTFENLTHLDATCCIVKS
jgi:hypothetical protein